MALVGNLQLGISVILGVAALGLEVFALVDAARHRPDAFVAAGKRTKNFWLAILGVACAIGFITVSRPLGIGILGVVGAAVYLADVRPAVRAVTGRGGSNGPYGRW